ncbi:MAG TPA: rhamnulokinase family protein [Bryobacteraceae bacterium]|nr:rhamnulokinase family protein [Bryobacteraceae bacterium]
MSAAAHLAIDLGAESGRVFLGRRAGGVMSIDEIHRFANRPLHAGDSLRWDVASLWSEVRTALSSSALPPIASLGVDAWGVDYGLIDEAGELLENPYHHRDARNLSAMPAALELLSRDEIYRATGVQFMPINTLYQLCAAQRDTPDLLARAQRLLMIPDLFHYWLSGNAVCEFTIASTTQFANPRTRQWSPELLTKLGIPDRLLAPIVEPGSILGDLLPGLKIGGGAACVVAPASHDTASAVAAISASGDTAFLSSGTWSLLGIELDAPVIAPESMRLNFTNEGGIAGTTRLLKNVMGLWMLQCCRNAWIAQGRDFSYAEIADAAAGVPAFAHLVDPDDSSFLMPGDMPAAIDRFCRRTNQPSPESPGAYTRAILESLALKYRVVMGHLESLIARPIHRIRIVGGGSKNRLLSQFTASATGKTVLAGPAEASVLGNLVVQMLATGGVATLRDARAIVDRSFPTEIFEPVDSDSWNAPARRFDQYCELNHG